RARSDLGAGPVTAFRKAHSTCALGYSDQTLGGVTLAGTEALLDRHFAGLRQNADISTNWVNTGQHIAQFDLGRKASYRAIQNDPATETYAAAIAGTYD